MTRPYAAGAAAALLLLVCSGAAAQPSPDSGAPRQPTSIETDIDGDVIRDLPNDGTLFSILETTEPSLISDRISTGGAYVGQAPRIGGFLSSWSQTLYRLGDVSLTDPTGSGAPLLLPDVDLWGAMRITTGMLAAGVGSPGVAVSLEPRAPSATWTTMLGGFAGGAPASGMATLAGGSAAPPFARLDAWDRAHATISGPLVADQRGNPKLSGFFGGSWTRAKAVFALADAPLSSDSGSAFAHLVFAADQRHSAHAIAWVQRNTFPLDPRLPFSALGSTTRDEGAHLQGWWERSAPALPVRVFAAYTRRSRTAAELSGSSGAAPELERLNAGPVSQLAFQAPGTVHQWTLGVRMPHTTSGLQTLTGGLEISRAADQQHGFFQGLAGELVDGIPARLWDFNAPAAAESHRHMTTVSADVGDTWAATPRLTLTGALRFDRVAGASDSAPAGITWTSWLPRATAAWTVVDRWQPTLFAGVSRSAYRLPLDLLAIGDPGAPTGNVYQWLAGGSAAASLASKGALIAAVGPGSNGNASFAAIDAGLKRPITDELTVGLEAHPSAALSLRAVGFLRREHNLLGITDPGAPAAAYAETGVFDPNLQLENPADDQILAVYDRSTTSFGQDRYLLTNPNVPAATSKSLEISAQLKGHRVTLFAGATANQSEASAAAVGFGPLENDQDILGDLFVDPNASTFARGRVFTDRAYTIKLASVVRLPQAFTFGIVARYQDGQPFSRLVVVPDLHQGAEAIRAFPTGESRFTFTGTLDVRLQKGFRIGRDRVEALLDGFNLLNMSNEVAEDTVSGAAFRTVTALQPPRAFHAGFRLTF